MERIAQFKSDFFVEKFGTIEQQNELLKQILAAKEQDVGTMHMSNDNCWRSNTKYENIDWLLNGVQDIAAHACEHYFAHDYTFKEHIKDHQIGIDYWTNVNEPGSTNVLHNHVADSFVAVYYLQGKNTGGLKFINPANLLSDCNPRSPFVRECVVHPTDGELILWPAWVPHEVLRNESTRQRINLAFSIQVS
jgi:uncharacterized protein (TIGR02466 family)